MHVDCRYEMDLLTMDLGGMMGDNLKYGHKQPRFMCGAAMKLSTKTIKTTWPNYIEHLHLEATGWHLSSLTTLLGIYVLSAVKDLKKCHPVEDKKTEEWRGRLKSEIENQK